MFVTTFDDAPKVNPVLVVPLLADEIPKGLATWESLKVEVCGVPNAEFEVVPPKPCAAVPALPNPGFVLPGFGCPKDVECTTLVDAPKVVADCGCGALMPNGCTFGVCGWPKGAVPPKDELGAPPKPWVEGWV